MHALRPLVGIVVFSTLACHTGPSVPATATPMSAGAVIQVGQNGAYIRIPLGRAATGTWKWYSAQTRDHYLEYEWGVRIVADTGAYHVGFKLFKPEGRRAAQGPLAALVRDGQIDIAHETTRDGQRTVAVTRYPITGRIEGDTFVFEITDSAAVAAVFRTRPLAASVLRYLNGARVPLADVPVAYAPDQRAGA